MKYREEYGCIWCSRKMTFEEADILLYYLVNLENVTKAKVI